MAQGHGVRGMQGPGHGTGDGTGHGTSHGTGHGTGHGTPQEVSAAVGRAAVPWSTAVSATLHCLTGCAIGEVLGLVLATWWGWPTWPSLALAITLAFLFGYSLTMLPLLRNGLSFRQALPVALAADTVSITVMEIVDNGVMLIVPGAMESGLADVLFWGALAFALAVAFVVTLPINRALIGRGKGHAVVHGHH